MSRTHIKVKPRFAAPSLNEPRLHVPRRCTPRVDEAS